MEKYVIYCKAALDGQMAEGYIKGFDARNNRLFVTYTKKNAKHFDDHYEADHYLDYVLRRSYQIRLGQLIRVSD